MPGYIPDEDRFKDAEPKGLNISIRAATAISLALGALLIAIFYFKGA
jgi:hypothetical protein